MEFVRLTLKLTKKLYADIVKVKEEQGYITITETVTKLIKMGLFVYEKSKNGRVIIATEDGTETEFLL